jgi:hypothetical protein
MMVPAENMMPEAALDPAIDIQQLECRFECGKKGARSALQAIGRRGDHLKLAVAVGLCTGKTSRSISFVLGGRVRVLTEDEGINGPGCKSALS